MTKTVLTTVLLLFLLGRAHAAADAPVVDFSSLPPEIVTNLPAFLVASFLAPGERASLNGEPVAPIWTGDLAIPVPLTKGANVLELVVASDKGERKVERTVFLDPDLSIADRELAFVDIDAPAVSGTVVLDLTNGLPLGVLEGRHVRGISPDGEEIYLHDRTVLSTDTLKPRGRLRFRGEIPPNGFLVSQDGSRLYSGRQVIQRKKGEQVVRRLPVDITTGSVWARANVPGGPALSPDDGTLYCCGSLTVVDTAKLRAKRAGLYGSYLSDIAVSPDGRHLLLAEYSWAAGRIAVYDTAGLGEVTTVTGLGDFVGEMVFSRDGAKLIVGSAGNPQSAIDGRLTVLDPSSFKKLSETVLPLADNLAVSSRDEVLVASGERAGVDSFRLQGDGTLVRTRTFYLGVGRFVHSWGEPKYDEVRKIILKD